MSAPQDIPSASSLAVADSASASSLGSSPGTPKSTNKAAKCKVDACQQKVVKIIGDCRYCQQKFCGTHRLPEMHACSGIDSCRTASHEKLSNKLMKEKTTGVKV